MFGFVDITTILSHCWYCWYYYYIVALLILLLYCRIVDIVDIITIFSHFWYCWYYYYIFAFFILLILLLYFRIVDIVDITTILSHCWYYYCIVALLILLILLLYFRIVDIVDITTILSHCLWLLDIFKVICSVIEIMNLKYWTLVSTLNMIQWQIKKKFKKHKYDTFKNCLNKETKISLNTIVQLCSDWFSFRLFISLTQQNVTRKVLKMSSYIFSFFTAIHYLIITNKIWIFLLLII
jgi:hypothetical protein